MAKDLKAERFPPVVYRYADRMRYTLNGINGRVAIVLATCLFLLGFLNHLAPRREPTRKFMPGEHSSVPLPIPKTVASLRSAYKRLMVEGDASTYVDVEGFKHKLDASSGWVNLERDICFVDVDSRSRDESLVMWYGEHTEGLSSGMINHIAYTSLHGYAYQWARVSTDGPESPAAQIVQEMANVLHRNRHCRFIVFMQLDVGFQDLGLPIEWIFNNWGVTENSTLAFAGLPKSSGIPGFTVAQVRPRTQELIDIWLRCLRDPSNGKACRLWKQAFSLTAKKESDDARQHESEQVKVLCDGEDVNRDCAYGVCDGEKVSCASTLLRLHRFPDYMDLHYPRLKLGNNELLALQNNLAQSFQAIQGWFQA